MTKLSKVPAVIKISAKCSDLFGADFFDAEGNEIAGYNGYVPKFFPDEHWGDYVRLDIELATGKILNWKPPSLSEINAALKDSTDY